MTRTCLGLIAATVLCASAAPPPADSGGNAPAAAFAREQGVPCHRRDVDLATLVREADGIIVADVVGQECRLTDGGRMIWTDSTLRVHERWKGADAGIITITEPGGVVPPLGVLVTGAPRHRLGSRALFFLTRDALGQRRTLAGESGRFEVAPSGVAGSAASTAALPSTVIEPGSVLPPAAIDALRATVATLGTPPSTPAGEVR